MTTKATTTHAPIMNVSRQGAFYYAIGLLFVGLTVVCLFTPSMLFFKKLASYTLYVMLGMLITAFVLFLMKQEKLMMLSLICCGILCLHMKSSANKMIRFAQVTSEPALKVSHINLGNAENNYDSIVKYLLTLDADFISVQELTPDWNAELTSRLSPAFQYMQTMTRLDQYGMGFFSKIPIQSIDTVLYRNVPNYRASLKIGGRLCNIIGCQIIPPVNQAAFMAIENHFNYLNNYMKKLSGSVIVLGDLHMPPWASEVQRFKDISMLQDSRRDMNPRFQDGSMSLPRIPVEHIFFSNDFVCTSFSELGNNSIGRIGIAGTYQLNKAHVEMAE